MNSNRIEIFAPNMAVNFVVMVRISLIHLLINKLSLSLSIKVARSYQDTFQNPDCLPTDGDCSMRPCTRYSAHCLTSACMFCECDHGRDTFTFNKGNLIGRCMTTDQLAQFPGKYSSMNACIDRSGVIGNMRTPLPSNPPPPFIDVDIIDQIFKTIQGQQIS